MIKDHDWANHKNELAMIQAIADDPAKLQVFQFIAEVLCEVNRVPLEPGSPDITAFNSGKQWVGRQLVQALTLPAERLIEEKHEREPTRVRTATDRATTGRRQTAAR